MNNEFDNATLMVVDTNIVMRAARLNFPIEGDVMDKRDQAESARASTVLGLMLHKVEIDLGDGPKRIRPVLCSTVVSELSTVLTRKGATPEHVKTVVKAITGLVQRAGGLIDPTGSTDPEGYRRAMSKRNRDNWNNGSTGTGDEAVLDAAIRSGGAILTEDGNFTDYARRRGTKVYSTEHLVSAYKQQMPQKAKAA